MLGVNFGVKFDTYVRTFLPVNIGNDVILLFLVEFFRESVCSFREIRLNMCYLSIVGNTVTLNQNVDMCA